MLNPSDKDTPLQIIPMKNENTATQLLITVASHRCHKHINKGIVHLASLASRTQIVNIGKLVSVISIISRRMEVNHR